MEQIILRFPHVLEIIFEKLDNKSLACCREVAKSWQKFIDERRYAWIRIVKIPTILQRGKTYLHLAAETGQTEIFELLFSEEDQKNSKDFYRWTPFHYACAYGQSKIAEILIKNSTNLMSQ